MPDRNRPDSSEWRLGLESGHPAEPRPERVEPRPEHDLSVERLGRPVYVVTAERLGWLAVGLYAVLSRLAGLGMRPLGRAEARAALLALELSRDGLGALAAHPNVPSGWLHALEGLFFAAAGASDFSLRLPGALLGLALIASAFALRPYLGRAGALAFAAMLALSPTITWFSCSAASSVAIAAPAIAAIALFLTIGRKPGSAKIALLGGAAALATSAELAGLAEAAMFAVILAVLGLRELLLTPHAGLRLRVWWERRAAFVMFGIVVASSSFYLFESDFLRRPFAPALLADARALWVPKAMPDFRRAAAFYLPALAFYEFLIVILGAGAGLAFIAFRIRSRLGAAAFLWTALSALFLLGAPERRPEWLVLAVVPAALLAAAGIDRLHHGAAWRFARYPIGALAILTLYVQVVSVFVYAAPDPSEAPWARHAPLFWSEPVTTGQTPAECRRAAERTRGHGAVFFTAQAPALEWYLRSLRRADNAVSADLVVSPTAPAGHPRASNSFTFEEAWKPDLGALTPARALRYFFAARAWNPLLGRDVQMEFHAAAPAALAAPASPVASSPAASTTLTPTAVPSAAASSVATPSPSLAPSPTPAATVPATVGARLTPPALSTPGLTGATPAPSATATTPPASSATPLATQAPSLPLTVTPAVSATSSEVSASDSSQPRP